MDDKTEERNCITLLGKSGIVCLLFYILVTNSVLITCLSLKILAMLGEQFMVGDEICGAVVSIRPNVSYSHGMVLV